MPRDIRHFEPDGVYFITNRCAGGRFLLTPGAEVNRIIKGAMAKYAHRHDIDLFGWLFMGNHFHIIPRSRSLKIPQFMRDMQRKISSEIQRLREDWDTAVFPKRYKCEPILGDAALRQKISYTLMNPVRAGLVRHPGRWPGVSSYNLHLEGGYEEASYLDRRRLRSLERKSDGPVDRSRAMSTYKLELTNPPSMAERTVRDAGRHILSDIDVTCRKWVEKHRLERTEFLGSEEVKEQSAIGRPEQPPEGAEPLCHTKNSKKRECYRRALANVTNRYREALERWRAGHDDVSFPPGTYPPGWMKAVAFEQSTGPETSTFASFGTATDHPRGDPNEAGGAD